MTESIKFYEVDKDYIAYLQQYDSKVPNVSYHKNNKFVCGIVLNVNGYDYYAPISSNKKQQKTNILIKDRNKTTLSSIKFSFMFPANNNYLTEMDFQSIQKQDIAYYNLLSKEYKFCKNNKGRIYKKAQQVYKMGCNPQHPYHKVCCNFKILEQNCNNYNK